MMKTKVRQLALAVCCASMTGTVYAKTPDQLVLNADSQTAIVVIKAEWWQPAPSMKSAFKVTLATYDPVEQKILGGPYSGNLLIEAQQKKFVDGYLIAAIKPGRWIYQSYSQQDSWALCFNANSIQFEVKPGEVIYLGEMDSQRHRQELTAEAVRSGNTSIRGSGFVDFFDLSTGPALRAIDESQLSQVREMLARNAPLITAPVHAAKYSSAIFGTGSTLFGQRRCGGYFAVGAKKK